MTKMTYTMAIDNAIALFSQGGQVDAEDRETVEKLEALKAQLAKRNSGNRKPSKTQEANKALREDIFAYVSENGAKSATEVAVYFGLSNQKATALLTAEVKSERLERFVEKRKAYFRVAEGM